MPISREIARSETAGGPPDTSSRRATSLISATASARRRSRQVVGTLTPVPVLST